MKRTWLLNDWRSTVFGFFYFSVCRIEVSLGRFAIFYFCIEPEGMPNSYLVSLYILGIGACLRLSWYKRR